MRLLGRLLGCIICLGAAGAPGASAAQAAGVDFTGTYRLVGPEGTLTITLRQAGGSVSGTMSDDTGTTMLIEGAVEEGELSGVASLGETKIEVHGTLRGPDRLSWTLQIEDGFGQEYLLDRVRAPGPTPGAAPGGQNPLASRPANPLAAPPSPWVGEFRKADGSLSLTIRSQGDGFAGTLAIRDQGGTVNEFPVTLRAEGKDLAGTFGVAPQSFPISLRIDPESDGRQVVVTSGDYVHTLERHGADQAGYRHPDGWYALSLPAGWRALTEGPLAVSLDAGKPGAFIAVLLSYLDPDEVGQPLPVLFQAGLTEIDALLSQDFGIRADSSGARATAVASAQHPAAEASWSGLIQAGPDAQPVRIWAGIVVEGEFVVLILAILNPEHVAEMVPQVQGVLGSARILKAPSAADLERLGEAAESPPEDPFAQPGGAPEFNRRITINGTRLDDATVAVLERGMGIQIPDYDYWYDPVCGAVGGNRGPAVAFFPPGLRLGGPLRPDASGGGSGMLTGVFVNGRELHPQDVIGLASIIGPVAMGRFWLDGQGNFGSEGGGVAGNLLLIARARQMQGAGGVGGGGGGGSEAWTRYKDFGGGEGGTHFGSFGGGDFYFSGGGAEWWPGK